MVQIGSLTYRRGPVHSQFHGESLMLRGQVDSACIKKKNKKRLLLKGVEVVNNASIILQRKGFAFVALLMW